MDKEIIKKIRDTETLLKLTQKVLKLEDQSFKSVLFVSTLIFAIEEIFTFIISEAIKMGITKILQDPDFINFTIWEVTLNSKIKVVKRMMKNNPEKLARYGKLFGYVLSINNIRNDIFHGKLFDLRYKDSSINLLETQHKMILDYFEASDEALGRL